MEQLEKKIDPDQIIGPKEIPNSWPGNCFGCSPRNPLGLQMKIFFTPEGCSSRIVLRPEYCGFDGIAHGGIVATILDEIAAWTLITQLIKLFMTTEAKISFYRPVPLGVPIIAEGRITQVNGNQVVTIATIKNQDGVKLAECESSWIAPGVLSLAKLTGKTTAYLEDMFQQFLAPIEEFRKVFSPRALS